MGRKQTTLKANDGTPDNIRALSSTLKHSHFFKHQTLQVSDHTTHRLTVLFQALCWLTPHAFVAWPHQYLATYLMVDAGEWCVVSDGFKRWPGPIPICGGCYFPAKLYGRLVDPSLAAALLRDHELGEVRVTGSDTDERIAWRRGFLSTILGGFFHTVIISQGDNLYRCKIGAFAWVWRK